MKLKFLFYFLCLSMFAYSHVRNAPFNQMSEIVNSTNPLTILSSTNWLGDHLGYSCLNNFSSSIVDGTICSPSCSLDGISMFVWLGDGDSQSTIGDATNDDEDNDDFIGFRNYGVTPVDISGWQLFVDQKGTGSPVFTFPNGTIIQPGHAFVVVSDWNGPNPLPHNWFDANFASGEGMFEENSDNRSWAILKNTADEYITIHQQGTNSAGQSLSGGTKLCNTNVTNLIPEDFDGCEMVYFDDNTCSYKKSTSCNVPILRPTIVADDDSFASTPIDSSTGGVTSSVLLNDNFDGGADGSANSSNSILSTEGNWTGFTLNTTTGVITVAAGTAPGTYTLTYRLCAQVNSTICDTATVTIVVTEACYRPGNFTSTGLPTKVGISSLRNDNSGNWPMVREGGWIALESQTKGFVPNRLSNLQIAAIPSANLVVGMMVYNTDEDCIQINVDGTATGWHCFKTPACPD